MYQLLGEYNCRIDDKGRLRLPTALLRQLGELKEYSFVVNRGYDQCLTLFPKNVWERVSRRVSTLPNHVKKNRDFSRAFFRGATDLTTDSSERILLPKVLLGYADITKDLVLYAYNDRIEIWEPSKYESAIIMDDEKYSSLAEDVLGDIDI